MGSEVSVNSVPSVHVNTAIDRQARGITSCSSLHLLSISLLWLRLHSSLPLAGFPNDHLIWPSKPTSVASSAPVNPLCSRFSTDY